MNNVQQPNIEFVSDPQLPSSKSRTKRSSGILQSKVRNVLLKSISNILVDLEWLKR